MKECQYIEFRLLKELPKTKVWAIISKKHGFGLGKIKYSGQWRQYIFTPDESTIWSSGCLSDVMGFLDEQNNLRKKKPSVSQKPDHITLGGKSESIEEWLLGGSIKKRDKKEKLSDEALLEYVKNKPCRCSCCADLKKRVLDKGVEEIDKYDGMICGGVEDIFHARGRY